MYATVNMGTEENPVHWGFIESKKEKSRILNLSTILLNNPIWIMEENVKEEWYVPTFTRTQDKSATIG